MSHLCLLVKKIFAFKKKYNNNSNNQNEFRTIVKKNNSSKEHSKTLFKDRYNGTTILSQNIKEYFTQNTFRANTSNPVEDIKGSRSQGSTKRA